MPLVIVGLLLLVAKWAEFGPFANWSWWVVLAPFPLAAVWWHFADSTGLTQKRAIEKMEQRKRDRRDKALSALGMDPRRDRSAGRARDAARNRAANIEQSDARDLQDRENTRSDPRL